MAAGLAEALANSVLDALCRGVEWTPPAALWCQLHVGDPGAAGVANPAATTARVQATFGTAADGGAVANTVALSWPDVVAAEDFTHVSAWDDETAGTFQLSGAVVADAVAVDDTFTLPVGAVVVRLNVAA
jgi:hypothetical protein